ncbi:LysR family transcriptional regulator [Roseobacteraceae bacterium S113]
MDNWDEIRTAFFVAREGTVSGAADALGVHHATVIRHIDALETRLGVKLFQRHARGYTPTDAGEDLARVARATDDQLSQLNGRLRGRGEEVSGELVITALPGMSDTLMPIMSSFQQKFPDIRLRYLAGERLFRLEYGEAHVALRAGNEPPDQLDNVVQSYVQLDMGLFASEDYIARAGPVDDLTQHVFVGPVGTERARAPFYRWLFEQISDDAIVFQTDDVRALEVAVRSGIGVGFVGRDRALDKGLIEVMAPMDEWRATLWLVTHVDLHRTPKVQAFLAHLKEHAAEVGR